MTGAERKPLGNGAAPPGWGKDAHSAHAVWKGHGNCNTTPSDQS